MIQEIYIEQPPEFDAQRRSRLLAKQLKVLHVPAEDEWADLQKNPMPTAQFFHLQTNLNFLEHPLVAHPP